MSQFFKTIRELSVDNGVQTGPFGSQLKSSEYVGSGISVIMPKDIKGGKILKKNAAKIPDHRVQSLRKHLLKIGDILFSRRGDLSAIGVVSADSEGSICGTGCLRARLSETVFPGYIHHFVQFENTTKWLETNALGQTMLNVNSTIIGNIPVYCPPLPEQKAIADTLSTWDAAIEKTERLIAAKEQILSSHREASFKKQSSSIRVQLGSVTRESTARNDALLERDTVMAVTKAVGMRPMREETIATSIDRYKVVQPNAFAYNPMRLNIGSIAMSHFDKAILVSPDYVVFECNEEKILPGLLDHLRSTQHWLTHFGNAGNGGVRVRIHYDELALFSFWLPPIAEQRKVLGVLDLISKEIDLLRKQLDLLKLQKRGLMQKLLTGTWRVPVRNKVAS